MVKGSKLDIVNTEKTFAATLDTLMNISVQCSLTIKTKQRNKHKSLRNYWGRKIEQDIR